MIESPPLIASDVEVVFDRRHTALRGLQFRAEPGEFVSLVGPSGCGKSTLLRLFAGLTDPTAGTVSAGGGDESHRIGFVFQDATLLPWRTAIENVALPLELQGVPAGPRSSAAAAALRLVGLQQADAAKFPRMLSGGMKMRVSLARAVVTEPDVMLLDEPFAALDEILRQQLNEELLGLWANKGWTTLFVTHNVVEAVFLSRRIAIFGPRPGRIVSEVSVPFDYPRQPGLRGTPEFARLVAEVSRILRSNPV